MIINYAYVVVLYNKKLDEIPILNLFSKDIDLKNGCHGLIVFDNSELPSKIQCKNAKIYNHSLINVGTAGAYRYAAEYAKNNDIDWLVLFDQDTDVDEKTLDSYHECIANRCANGTGAVLPKVQEGARVISPCVVTRWGTMITNVKTYSNGSNVSGISSGSIVSATVIRNILCEMRNGLWLDYVDHWVFLKMRVLGFRVECCEIELQHTLSINNKKNISAFRFLSIAKGELIFCREINVVAFLSALIRLNVRFLKYSIENKKLVFDIFNILFKKNRI